ncbi:MAG: DUF1343 domain-containing protein [Isosphaeraceae bacterium]
MNRQGHGPPRVTNGLDVLVVERFARLKGRRVGAIANPTSVDHQMHHLADHLHQAVGVNLVALFGPEHGVRADAQDMIGVHSSRDSRTGVPVHSLYGADVATLTPSPSQLDGVDCLVFDVQDVGSRYYTFATTMLYAMRAAETRGLTFFVLDRPNPIGGEAIEGPILQPGFESFIGPHPIPIRHGLTVGELALLYRDELRLDLDLQVVACQGWTRSMCWSDTGLPWVLPSPNMSTPETALVYPGACLIEGTNLSEGRGTTRPFELWGAPWIDPHALAAQALGELTRLGRDQGMVLRPCSFRPMFHKHAGTLCQGVQPHVNDPDRFRPVAVYTVLLALTRAQAPDQFAWRTEPYEFVRDPIAIDLLYGSSRERELMESGSPCEDLFSLFDDAWACDEAAFRDRRAPYLLYNSTNP